MALTLNWTLQAVMIGPLTMAGLTDGSRKITANASDLASLVSDVKEEGLVSLRLLDASDVPLGNPLGTPTHHLQHTGENFQLGEVTGSNAAKMAATFRVVQLDQRYVHGFLPCPSMSKACCTYKNIIAEPQNDLGLAAVYEGLRRADV